MKKIYCIMLVILLMITKLSFSLTVNDPQLHADFLKLISDGIIIKGDVTMNIDPITDNATAILAKQSDGTQLTQIFTRQAGWTAYPGPTSSIITTVDNTSSVDNASCIDFGATTSSIIIMATCGTSSCAPSIKVCGFASPTTDNTSVWLGTETLSVDNTTTGASPRYQTEPDRFYLYGNRYGKILIESMADNISLYWKKE